jgi:hypothetical protein
MDPIRVPVGVAFAVVVTAPDGRQRDVMIEPLAPGECLSVQFRDPAGAVRGVVEIVGEPDPELWTPTLSERS